MGKQCLYRDRLVPQICLLFLVRWHASAFSLHPGEVIFPQLGCPQGSISSTVLAKSEWQKAQSCQQIAKKIRTLCAENLQSLSWQMATIEKQHFCHSREKETHKYEDEIDASRTSCFVLSGMTNLNIA
jgi:hypothetical protein